MKKEAETIVVSGFPGTGKSYYVNHDVDYMPQNFAIDSDSSKFDRKDFPQNYINHIKSNIGKVKIIFVSSHKEVRDALVENKIPFTLVYPNRTLKIEYMKRYIERGSSDGFIDLIFKNWEDWIVELSLQENCKHIVLNSGEYLSNTLEVK